MILSAIITAVYYIIFGLISLLPTGAPIPVDWINGLNNIFNTVSLFSLITPLATIIQILTFALYWHLFVWIWNTIHWVYGVIRGVSYLPHL